MKELVEVIARALVDNPDEVVVTETEKEDTTVIELKVAPSDMGKVIGKQGRIAKAIRSVVKAAASQRRKESNRRYSVNKERPPKETAFFITKHPAERGAYPAGHPYKKAERCRYGKFTESRRDLFYSRS